MNLVDFSTPIAIGLSVSAVWHANVLFAVMQKEPGHPKRLAIAVAFFIFISNVSGAMWAARIVLELSK